MTRVECRLQHSRAGTTEPRSSLYRGETEAQKGKDLPSLWQSLEIQILLGVQGVLPSSSLLLLQSLIIQQVFSVQGTVLGIRGTAVK